MPVINQRFQHVCYDGGFLHIPYKKDYDISRDLPRSTHQPPTNVELFGGILAVLVALGLWLAQHEVPITDHPDHPTKPRNSRPLGKGLLTIWKPLKEFPKLRV